MEDQLISFDTAKLAKEKGFDEICENWWVETLEHKLDIPRSGIEIFPARRPRILPFKPVEYYHIVHGVAPTQSLLQKWLREKHDIHIHVIATKLGFRVYVSAKGNRNLQAYKAFDTEFSYEEALEKGLQEALKLIKNN